MHRVVSDLPDWQAIDAEQAEIDRQVAKLAEFSRRVRREHEEALRGWEVAFAASIANGGEPPPRPPDPDPQPPLGQQLQRQRIELVDRRAYVLRANRAVILGRARERAGELLDQARGSTLGQLGPIAKELSEIALALRQALGDGDRFQPAVTALDVCKALLAGADPLFTPNPALSVDANAQADEQPRIMRDDSGGETVQEVHELFRRAASRGIVRRFTGTE